MTPTIEPKPVKERDNIDLLELTLQLHSRALIYNTNDLNDAYVEARKELETRFAASLNRQGWTRADKELSQHYIKVGCRLIGTDYYFTAAYDWSRETYRGMDGRDYEIKDIEWWNGD